MVHPYPTSSPVANAKNRTAFSARCSPFPSEVVGCAARKNLPQPSGLHRHSSFALSLGLKPQLRVIEGGKTPDVRQPLEQDSKELKNTG